MTTRSSPFRAVALLPLMLLIAPIGATAHGRTELPNSLASRAAAGPAEARRALAGQRPVFIENRGQWDERAKFLLRSPGLDVWITDNGVVYDVSRIERVDQGGGSRLASGAAVEGPMSGNVPQLNVTRAPVFITFEGASKKASAVGSGKLPQFHNYYLGNDRSHWAKGVSLFTNACVQGLYDGVDAVFYLENGRPRYDLRVGAGADPASIRMKIEGATSVTVAPSGSLQIATALGTVEQRELFAYQEVAGRKRKVPCAFAVARDRDVTFTIGDYDRSRPLVIDPLVYSTYLGGSGDDVGNGIAVDIDGNAYVTGVTPSANFPTLDAAQGSFAGGADAFVTKLAKGGALVYSTYLGGIDSGGGEVGHEVVVDAGGSAHVVGQTGATNFPTLNAFQTSNGGGPRLDAFVAKLTPSGALSYSTYLGGVFNDMGYGIALDGSGNTYVAGHASTSTFPGRGSDPPDVPGFVSKLTSSGALVYSKFLVGEAHGVAVDGNGDVYCTGTTPNNNTGIAQNAFATKHRSNGDEVYSVTFGGDADNEIAEAIGVDGGGNAYITGTTRSSDFPTQSAVQPGFGGDYDAFVTKLTPSGAISYSTFIGTASQEFGFGIVVGEGGDTFVAGVAGPATSALVTPGAVQSDGSGASSAFVMKMSATGAVTYFTLLGGSGHDGAQGIAVDADGIVYVTGSSSSPDFPTRNPSQAARAGGSDAYVASLSFGPPPVESFFLPRIVRVKVDVKNAAKSTLLAVGGFDTGSAEPNLASAATLDVGGLHFDIPGLVPKGKSFTFAGDGVAFSITPRFPGSSRAKFSLKFIGDLAGKVSLDAPLELHFKNASSEGVGSVALNRGFYAFGKVRGALIEPNVYTAGVRATLRGVGKDKLLMRVGLATNGVTPPSASDLSVRFGELLDVTIPAAAFKRKGDADVFVGNVDGVTSAIVDHARERITVVCTGLSLGTFSAGGNSMTVGIALGAEQRTVDVRMALVGPTVRY
jgi:hypothetical protein